MKDIAFHITDITENCLRAGADEVGVRLSLRGDELTLVIKDNGCGMDEQTLLRAINPFYTTRTTRKVGLGLPFLIQNAEQSGGYVDVESTKGVGTSVTAVFDTANIDCPPLGDIAQTMMLLITGNPDVNMVFDTDNGTNCFTISTHEIKEVLDGIPLGLPEVSVMVGDIISENLENILIIKSDL